MSKKKKEVKSPKARLSELKARKAVLEKKWLKVSRKRTSGDERKAKNALDLELCSLKIERKKLEKEV